MKNILRTIKRKIWKQSDKKVVGQAGSRSSGKRAKMRDNERRSKD
jgi:hypothetical protein